MNIVSEYKLFLFANRFSKWYNRRAHWCFLDAFLTLIQMLQQPALNSSPSKKYAYLANDCNNVALLLKHMNVYVRASGFNVKH